MTDDYIMWLPKAFRCEDGTVILPGWIDIRVLPIPLHLLDASKRFGAR